MRIAITGGTGFVGRHLATRLAEAGHETVILSRRTGSGLEIGAERLGQALRDCDAVVRCAGINREIGEQTYDAVKAEAETAAVATVRSSATA